MIEAFLGKKLMDLYLNFYRKCGYHSAYLWTANGLEAAAALYPQYGFILTEEQESTTFGKG